MRGVKEGYTIDYAGFWVRLVALLIDVAILVLVYVVINNIYAGATGEGWMWAVEEEVLVEELIEPSSTWFINLLILIVLSIAYFIGFWAWRGQTPGKMAVRVRIVRLDGSSIGWIGAAMRCMGCIITGLPFLAGFLWVALDARKQGLHDKLAETFVVRVARKAKVLEAQE